MIRVGAGAHLKTNEPAPGGFVSLGPGRPGKGGVTPEHPVGVLEALVPRDPCKVSVTTVFSRAFYKRFQIFEKNDWSRSNRNLMRVSLG